MSLIVLEWKIINLRSLELELALYCYIVGFNFRCTKALEMFQLKPVFHIKGNWEPGSWAVGGCSSDGKLLLNARRSLWALLY